MLPTTEQGNDGGLVYRVTVPSTHSFISMRAPPDEHHAYFGLLIYALLRYGVSTREVCVKYYTWNIVERYFL